MAGKPRPFVIVQDPRYDFADTLIVVPLTTEDTVDRSIRPLIRPDDLNGLRNMSCAMINRLGAIMKSDIDKIAGRLSDDDLTRIDAALTSILGVGGS